MRRPKLLLAAGTAAFLLFIVALLPASLVLRYVPPEFELRGVSGSVWWGRATEVLLRGQPLGALRWSNRPWRLALLELNYALQLEPAGGAVRLDLRTRGDGRIELLRIRGGFPVTATAGVIGPEGWAGEVEPNVDWLILRGRYPVSASGTVTVRELTAPGNRGANIGTFELTLGEGAVGAEGITGRLRDLGKGPMRVRATLELKPDGSYLISGEVTALPEAGPVVLRTLAFLPPPDSLGRRPFAIEGTL